MWVEVAYATAEQQTLLRLQVADGTTLQQAIVLSNILQLYPQIDLSKDRVGIFGKIQKLESVLREKDRVEIYRPLIADPKKVRKQRAAEGRKMRGSKK